jgi:hypothetical protein
MDTKAMAYAFDISFPQAVYIDPMEKPIMGDNFKTFRDLVEGKFFYFRGVVLKHSYADFSSFLPLNWKYRVYT